MESLLRVAILALAIAGGFMVADRAQGQMVPYVPATRQGTPVTNSFSGADTSTQSITLPAAAAGSGQFTYICGFSVGGLGATALANVNVTVATLVGGKTLTYTYQMPAGATVAAPQLIVTFPVCLPGNAASTAITITVPGAAGNTSTVINAHGFQL